MLYFATKYDYMNNNFLFYFSKMKLHDFYKSRNFQNFPKQCEITMIFEEKVKNIHIK